MKIPRKTLRMLMLLPDDFRGEISLSSNGCGSFQMRITHLERFTAQGDAELLDLTPEAQLGALDLHTTKPRR